MAFRRQRGDGARSEAARHGGRKKDSCKQKTPTVRVAKVLEHFRALCRVGAFVKGDLAAGQTRAGYTCDSRQKDGLLLLAAFKAWLDKLALKVAAQSLPGTAIAHMGIPCEYLSRYVADGCAYIDDSCDQA